MVRNIWHFTAAESIQMFSWCNKVLYGFAVGTPPNWKKTTFIIMLSHEKYTVEFFQVFFLFSEVLEN